MSITLKYLLKAAVAGIAVLLLIQLIPYGKSYSNPPVLREPSWDSPATRAIAKRACFDCHSNETVWPGYARIAPLSWLVRYDVDEGRSELNFSEWQSGAREGERPDKISREISKGKMPPFIYLPTHPDARLSDAEKQQLIEGLRVTALRR